MLPICCLGMLESDAPRSRKSSQVRFSYTQSEGYNNSIVDCESIKRIKVKYVIASGFNSLMYGAKADLSKELYLAIKLQQGLLSIIYKRELIGVYE